MATKKSKALPQSTALSGEGFRLPIDYIVNADGQSQVRMEFASSPAPTHKFVADEFSIIEGDGKVRLVFVQLNVLGTPRSLVDIHVEHGAVTQFIGIFTAFGEITNPAPQYELREEPPEAIALWATHVRASVATPVSAVLDFYYSSPFALNYSPAVPWFYAQDVVRIQLSEQLCRSFAHAMREISAKFTVHK